MKTRILPLVLAAACAVAAWLLARREAPRGPPAREPEEEARGDGVDDSTSRGHAGSDPRDASSAAPGAPASDLPVLDRAKRDQMRALLWRSFGQEAPDAAPPEKSAYVLPDLPPWPMGPSDSGPGIEPKYIQQQVRSEFFPLARKCYADMSERIPDAGGTAVLAFNIVGNQNIGGIVEQVDVLNESTLRDPAFVDCMRQSFLSVTFPPPEGGGMVSVKYPIVFSPEEESD